jgi:hypothetical protein
MSFTIMKTLDIGAPPEIVWEVLTDFPKYGEWNPFVVEAKCSLKPGEAMDMKVVLMGFPQRQVEWMRECHPGQDFSYAMKPFPLGGLSSRRGHVLEPAGAGRTRYTSQFELQGWMMPLVRGLMGARIEIGMRGMWEALQRRSEELWAQRKPKAA